MNFPQIIPSMFGVPPPLPAPDLAEVDDAELFRVLQRAQRAGCIQDAMAMLRKEFRIVAR